MPENNKKFYGWHFRGSGGLSFGDNRHPQLGQKLVYRTNYSYTCAQLPTVCQVGMHASECVTEAVRYADHTSRLTRVLVEDDIDYDEIYPDKISGRYRTVLASLSQESTWEICNILQEIMVEIFLSESPIKEPIEMANCHLLRRLGVSGLSWFNIPQRATAYHLLNEVALDYIREHGEIAEGRGLTGPKEPTDPLDYLARA